MTLGLEKAAVKNVPLQPSTVNLAARIFFLNKDIKKASDFWSLYFKMQDAKPCSMDYASAGLAFDASGAYEEARDVFETYLASTPREEHMIPCLFGLGRIYASLGDANRSAACFGRILEASHERQAQIVDCPSPWFMSAVATYVVTNNKRDLMRMIALHDRLKPRAPSLLNCTIRVEKGRSAPRKGTKLRVKDKVQAIHAHLVQVETSRCRALQGRLEKMNFSSFEGKLDDENERRKHLGDLDTLMAHIANLGRPQTQANSSHGPEPMTILSIQREVGLLERGCESLERTFQNARHEKSKQNALAYLRSLGTRENELDALVPTQNPNLRSLYGHVKLSTGSHGSDFGATSSLSQEPSAVQVLGPEVMFTRLKSIEGDLTTLQSIPGLKAKYTLFMDEVAQDPFAQSLRSGKVKTLVGEKGIFSRRLDDANRLVYRVEILDDGHVHVCILNVLGHYKHLKDKLAQTSVVAHKTPKPARSKGKKRGAPKKSGR